MKKPIFEFINLTIYKIQNEINRKEKAIETFDAYVKIFEEHKETTKKEKAVFESLLKELKDTETLLKQERKEDEK